MAYNNPDTLDISVTVQDLAISVVLFHINFSSSSEQPEQRTLVITKVV